MKNRTLRIERALTLLKRPISTPAMTRLECDPQVTVMAVMMSPGAGVIPHIVALDLILGWCKEHQMKARDVVSMFQAVFILSQRHERKFIQDVLLKIALQRDRNETEYLHGAIVGLAEGYGFLGGIDCLLNQDHESFMGFYANLILALENKQYSSDFFSQLNPTLAGAFSEAMKSVMCKCFGSVSVFLAKLREGIDPSITQSEFAQQLINEFSYKTFALLSTNARLLMLLTADTADINRV